MKVSIMLALLFACLEASACFERLPNADNIPPGTYKSSCFGCQVVMDDQDEVLTCECLMANDELNQTVYYLDGSCKSFSNRGGELVCDDPVGAATAQEAHAVEAECDEAKNLPDGPYKKVCSRCIVTSSNVLKCQSCLNDDGLEGESSLDLPKGGCTVGCLNGILQCQQKDEL